MHSDSILELEFKEKELNEYWLREQEFPLIFKATKEVLMPFASTYLCETSFSTLLYLLNKHRSCLSPESLESISYMRGPALII